MKGDLKPGTYFIGVNGPPGCGKDEFVKLVMEEYNRGKLFNNAMMIADKFAAPLKGVVHHFLGYMYDEAAKDRPNKYSSVTHRDLYISFSEEWAKVQLGKGIFGELAVMHMMQVAGAPPFGPTVFLFSDSGFFSEYEPVMNTLGAANCGMIKLTRPGKTFDGDSRSYWMNMAGVPYITVHNEGTLDDLRQMAIGAVQTIASLRGWYAEPERTTE